MELVKENSTYTTSEFLKRLEKNLGFKVKLVQTDNGIEFVNDKDITNKKTRFEKYLEKLDKNTNVYVLTRHGKMA